MNYFFSLFFFLETAFSLVIIFTHGVGGHADVVLIEEHVVNINEKEMLGLDKMFKC